MSALSSAEGYAPRGSGYMDAKAAQDHYQQGYTNLIQQLSHTRISPGQIVESVHASPEFGNTPSRTSSDRYEQEARTPPDSAPYFYLERGQEKQALPHNQQQQLQHCLEKFRRPSDHEHLEHGSRPGHYLQSQSSYDAASSVEMLNESRPVYCAKGKLRSPTHEASSAEHSRQPSAINSVMSDNDGGERPFTKLSHQDIVFCSTNIPERSLNARDCREILASAVPAICEAPRRAFDEDGTPLPPTKKQETTPEEREARKEALAINFIGKTKLSLVKAMVILENRSGSWRRVGATAAAGSSSAPSSPSSSQRKLPPMPSPWAMEIRHQDLDVATIKGKSKSVFEMPGCRQDASCHRCSGQGREKCGSCRGEAADECFWCAGTGSEKGKGVCRRCRGEGVLKCTSCDGALTAKCKACDGVGLGQYGYFVEVKVKRVEMPTVSVSALVPMSHPSAETVRTAAIMRLLESTQRLAEAGTSKSKPYVPVMAACSWETSVSHIVEVKVPLTARFKKGGQPALRPEGLSRKIATATRFFSIPSDPDLRPTELTKDEVAKTKLELGSGVPTSRSDMVAGSPSRPVTPAGREFVPKPSPLHQLAASEQVASYNGYEQPTDYVGYYNHHAAPMPPQPQPHGAHGTVSSRLLGKLQRTAAV